VTTTTAEQDTTSSQPFSLWEAALLSLITLVGGTIRYHVFLVTQHIDYDSTFRIGDAVTHSANPFHLLEIAGFSFANTGATKGFYFLNALLIHFYGEPILTTKLVSVIPGVLVLIPMYFWLRMVFDRLTAIGGTAALALYLPHIAASGVPGAFPGMIFFLALAGFLVEKTARSQSGFLQWPWLFLAALATVGATAFRVEGWLLPFLFSWCLWKRIDWKKIVFFFLLASGYILYQHHLDSQTQADTIRFFVRFKNFFSRQVADGIPVATTPFDDLSSRWVVYLQMLCSQVTILTLILSFFGVGLVIKQKVHDRVFATGFMITLVVLTARGLISGHTTYERYSLTIGFFALPLAFVAIGWILDHWIPQKFRHRFLKGVGVVVLIGLISVALVIGLPKRIQCMKFNSAEFELIDWIIEDASPGDFYIINAPIEIIAYGLAQRLFDTYSFPQHQAIPDKLAENDPLLQKMWLLGKQILILTQPGKQAPLKRVRVIRFTDEEFDQVIENNPDRYQLLFKSKLFIVFAPNEVPTL